MISCKEWKKHSNNNSVKCIVPYSHNMCPRQAGWNHVPIKDPLVQNLDRIEAAWQPSKAGVLFPAYLCMSSHLSCPTPISHRRPNWGGSREMHFLYRTVLGRTKDFTYSVLAYRAWFSLRTCFHLLFLILQLCLICVDISMDMLSMQTRECADKGGPVENLRPASYCRFGEVQCFSRLFP